MALSVKEELAHSAEGLRFDQIAIRFCRIRELVIFLISFSDPKPNVELSASVGGCC